MKSHDDNEFQTRVQYNHNDTWHARKNRSWLTQLQQMAVQEDETPLRQCEFSQPEGELDEWTAI